MEIQAFRLKMLTQMFYEIFSSEESLKNHSSFLNSTIVKKEYFLTIHYLEHDLFIMIVAYSLSRSQSIQRRHIIIVPEVGQMQGLERHGIVIAGLPIMIRMNIKCQPFAKRGLQPISMKHNTPTQDKVEYLKLKSLTKPSRFVCNFVKTNHTIYATLLNLAFQTECNHQKVNPKSP